MNVLVPCRHIVRSHAESELVLRLVTVIGLRVTLDWAGKMDCRSG
jgi:hypothetical protein